MNAQASGPLSPFGVTFQPPPDRSATWRFSCKEMFDVAGYPATCGHPRFGQRRAGPATSPLVAHFQKAGATLVGKTLQSELAFSGLGDNPHYQMPHNPRRPGHVTGGSSAGCAVAVATDAVDFSIATDSAGSARIPAACCDVIGISLANQTHWSQGVVSLSPTHDQLGILAANPVELRRALELLLATQSQIPESLIVPERLVATHCDDEVRSRFDSALAILRDLGIRIELTSVSAFHEVERRQDAEGTPVLAEIAASLASFVRKESHDVSPAIVERLEPYLDWDPIRTRDLTERVTAPLREFRRTHDVPLLLPTLPMMPPRLGSAAVLGTLTKFANLLGESSISFPVPGLGLSIMLITTDPATLLAVAELVGGDVGISKKDRG